MTDDGNSNDIVKTADSWMETGKNNIILIYILYLAGFVIGIVVGLQAVTKDEPIKNPQSWLI